MSLPPSYFPSIEEFPAWMRQQLDWPDDGPLSQGAFDLLRRTSSWEWRKELEARWCLDDLLPLLQRHDISATAMLELFGWRWRHLDQPYLRSKKPKPSELLLAECELRHDLEIRGRGFVVARGIDSYLQRLNDPEVSEHDRIETMLSWRERGFFEPQNSAFRARFNVILERHAGWLKNKPDGERARLCGQDMRDVKWPRGALRKADLRGAILRNLNLDGDDLSGCDLRGADLLAARFVETDLQAADLRNSDLTLALFQGANLLRTKKDKTYPHIAQLTDWDGQGVKGHLSMKVHWDLDWRYLDLRQRSFASFSGDTLDGPDFRYTNLEGASFHGTAFSEFDGRYANLRGADLSLFSCLFGSPNFENADLTGANVWAADFRGATFQGAILTNLQNGDSAQWNDEPPRDPNFRGANFSGALLYARNFEGCDCQNTNFVGADLRDANFAQANLQNADLRRANIEGAIFSGANLDGASYSPAKMRLAKR